MNALIFKKLSRMSLEELAFRMKTAIGQRLEKMVFRLGLRRNPVSAFKSGVPSQITFPYPWFDSNAKASALALFHSDYPDYVLQIKEAAEAICAHRFAFFEATFTFGEKIPWLADPVTGKTRPPLFHTKVDIFGGDTGAGDVKYVWELNRHQFIPTLGKAYWLTGEERYAEEALSLLDDWILENPYLVGINWTSALEVAVRSLAWSWGCAFFESSKHFTAERRKGIVRSLYQHGLYLERHLSYFFSPYNHLIGEATALYTIGSLFPLLKSSSRWEEIGWQILEAEMPKQFHPDGGTVEQATGYHFFTLGFYLQALLIRQRQAQEPPRAIRVIFENVFDYAMHMTRPDGEIPMIGDGDEGKALPLYQASRWDFRPFLAIGAALFQRGDFKKMAGPFPPDALWLIGPEAFEAYRILPEALPVETSKAFPSSGYNIMRTGWDREAHYLNFDCGELADGLHPDEIPSAAHGHADALSFELSAFGRPMMIDPGFYTYNGPVAWHRYFRETAAHNTVVVDGQSQAAYKGRLTWSHAPKTRRLHWAHTQAADFVSGMHEGYARLPQPVEHHRSILFFKPDYWLIRDKILGSGVHQVDRYFHFRPGDLSCDEASMAVRTEGADDANLLMRPCEKGHGEIHIIQKGESPDEGWMAPGYGLKVQAPVVRYRSTGPVPLCLHTLILPFKRNCPVLTIDPVKIESTDALALGRAFSIHTESGSDLVVYASGDGLATFYDNWQTDAQVTSIRRDREGTVVSVFIIDGSTVRVAGKMLLKIEKKVPFAGLSFDGGRPFLELSEAVDVESPYSEIRQVISPSNGNRNP